MIQGNQSLNRQSFGDVVVLMNNICTFVSCISYRAQPSSADQWRKYTFVGKRITNQRKYDRQLLIDISSFLKTISFWGLTILHHPEMTILCSLC